VPQVTVKNIKLEKTAINDALPLKTAHGHDIANLNFLRFATPTTLQARCPFYHETELSWSKHTIFLAPNVGQDPKFYGIIEARLAHTVWLTLVDLRSVTSVRRLAKKENAEYMTGCKMWVILLAIYELKFIKF